MDPVDWERVPYIFISSVASRPTMCKMASRPPGCWSIHSPRCKANPSWITIGSPCATCRLISAGEIVLCRDMIAGEGRGGEQELATDLIQRDTAAYKGTRHKSFGTLTSWAAGPHSELPLRGLSPARTVGTEARGQAPHSHAKGLDRERGMPRKGLSEYAHQRD